MGNGDRERTSVFDDIREERERGTIGAAGFNGIYVDAYQVRSVRLQPGGFVALTFTSVLSFSVITLLILLQLVSPFLGLIVS